MQKIDNQFYVKNITKNTKNAKITYTTYYNIVYVCQKIRFMGNMVYKYDGYEIEQREDGLFNATLLIEQWNAEHECKKRLDVFFKSDNARELMYSRSVRFVREVDGYSVGRPKTTVWLDGTLFTQLCAWLAPSMYADAATVLTAEPETLFRRTARALGISDNTEQRERLVSCLNYAATGGKRGSWLSLPESERNGLRRVMAEHIGDIENGTLDLESYIGILKDIYISNQKTEVL